MGFLEQINLMNFVISISDIFSYNCLFYKNSIYKNNVLVQEYC